MRESLTLIDCTLRDGSYAIDYRWTQDHTRRLCSALEDAGVRYIEIGHGVGLNGSSPSRGVTAATDEEYCKAAASVLSQAQFGAFFIPGIGRREDIDMARSYGMGFLRIGTNVTQVQDAKPFIEQAVRLGYLVSYNAMKSYLLPPREFAKAVAPVVGWGAQVVSVVDSAGCLLPDDVSAYVSELRERIDAKIGFHGHNNLQMANANSIAAFRAGASFVDSTLQGIGRGGGNAQTEGLVATLERMGVETGIDVMKVLAAGETLVRPQMDAYGGGGVSSIDVAMGIGGFHSSYFPRIEDVVSRIPVDPKLLVIELGKRDRLNPSVALIEEVAKGLLDAASSSEPAEFASEAL